MLETQMCRLVGSGKYGDVDVDFLTTVGNGKNFSLNISQGLSPTYWFPLGNSSPHVRSPQFQTPQHPAASAMFPLAKNNGGLLLRGRQTT